MDPVTHIWLGGLTRVELPLTNEFAKPTDRYIVKSIDGLDPPEVSVSIANTESGGKYQARQPQMRQIVMLISLHPDWDKGETPKKLREELYTMLSTGYNPAVSINLIHNLTIMARTFGYISKFEAALWSKDPAVQITFDCTDAVFKARTPTVLDANLIDERKPDILNTGTAETGFQMTVKFTAARADWYIRTENPAIGMRFVYPFAVNDVLSISTIPGSRYIHWNKRRGKVTNKMGILTADSEWIGLHPGLNHFATPPSGWVFQGNVVYTAQFWGA